MPAVVALLAAAVTIQVSREREGSHDVRLVDKPGIASRSNLKFDCDPQHTNTGIHVDGAIPAEHSGS
jgi:hypothetical protein